MAPEKTEQKKRNFLKPCVIVVLISEYENWDGISVSQIAAWSSAWELSAFMDTKRWNIIDREKFHCNFLFLHSLGNQRGGLELRRAYLKRDL